MPLRLDITDAPEPRLLDILGSALMAYNDADAGPAERRSLAIWVHDEDDRFLGGLSGYTGWGWLFVQWLWLEETVRGQGLAGRLLAMAEDEAVARGCHGAYIDTFNPVARRAYEKAGYRAFGALPDFPKGRERVFLQKSLGA